MGRGGKRRLLKKPVMLGMCVSVCVYEMHCMKTCSQDQYFSNDSETVIIEQFNDRNEVEY